MKAFYSAVVFALLSVAAGSAHADNNFGVGVKVGTLGAGIEGTWRPLPYLDLRVGTNVFEFDDEDRQAGVSYDATLNLDTVYGTANLHFPLSPFRVSAGLFANNNELEFVSTEAGTFEVGGVVYNAQDVGTLRGLANFESTSPYLGFGYDFSLFNKVSLNLDLGVLWQGEPEVVLTADGAIASNPTFQQSLEVERQELEDEVSDFKAYPVISLGFVYNF